MADWILGAVGIQVLSRCSNDEGDGGVDICSSLISTDRHGRYCGRMIGAMAASRLQLWPVTLVSAGDVKQDGGGETRRGTRLPRVEPRTLPSTSQSSTYPSIQAQAQAQALALYGHAQDNDGVLLTTWNKRRAAPNIYRLTQVDSFSVPLIPLRPFCDPSEVLRN
jgi:hypothetical protein